MYHHRLYRSHEPPYETQPPLPPPLPHDIPPPLPPPLPHDTPPLPPHDEFPHPPPPPSSNQIPPQPRENPPTRLLPHPFDPLRSHSFFSPFNEPQPLFNEASLPPLLSSDHRHPPAAAPTAAIDTRYCSPRHGNYESRYNPGDVAMPTQQSRSNFGYTVSPLFTPEEIHAPRRHVHCYRDEQSLYTPNPNFPERPPIEYDLSRPRDYRNINPNFTHNVPDSSHLIAAGPVCTVRKLVPAETIFDLPGRKERPSHIVIILRGLPGSGKSHLAKLMKEKEVYYLASAPRILSIDTYFVNEIDKIEKDPETGRRVKRKVEEYEYDVALEPTYLASMLKQFNKTLSEGYFSMILVDAINSKISDFDQFWSNAKMKGFESFVVELKEPIDTCAERNIHSRTREEIELLAAQWEPTPPHFLQLDVTSLLSPQDTTTIDEVDMEMVDSDKEDGSEELPQSPSMQPGLVKSRWEQEAVNEDMLDKLDGFKKRKRSHEEDGGEENLEELTLKEYLQGKGKDSSETDKPAKKRVRWADLEAAKEELRKKEIGFTIGSSWSKVSEEEVTRILHQPTDEDNHSKRTSNSP